MRVALSPILLRLRLGQAAAIDALNDSALVRLVVKRTCADDVTPLIAPCLAEPSEIRPAIAKVIYRQRIAALYESLQSEDGKAEAAELFRTLVDQATLVPDQAELAIVLRGDLAAILLFAANKKNPTSFRKPGFWVPCFRRNRWLRGHATPDSCD